MTDSNQNFGVRRATPADFDALVPLVLELVTKEVAILPVSEQCVVDTLERCIARDGALAGVIEGANGAIEGTIGLTLERFFYSDQDYLEMKWLGVSAAYRKRIDRERPQGSDWMGVPTRLLRFGKWAADAMDVALFLPILTTTDLARKMRLYQRQAPQLGAVFGYGALPDHDYLNQVVHGDSRDGVAGLPRSLASGQGQPSPATA